MAQTAFDAARVRLAGAGWDLVRAGADEFAAWKRFAGGLHEISLPSLDRLEESCREYDELQETRERARRERERERSRLERDEREQAQIDAAIRRARQRMAEATAALEADL